MKLSTSVAAVAAATTLGAGALTLPVLASARHPGHHTRHKTSHTLKFTSVTKRQHGWTKTESGQSDIDKSKAGKLVGFDQLNVTFDPTTHTESGDVAIDAKGGIMLLTLKIAGADAITGKLVGGTGDYKHATGTLSAHNLNKSGTRTAVTVKYQD